MHIKKYCDLAMILRKITKNLGGCHPLQMDKFKSERVRTPPAPPLDPSLLRSMCGTTPDERVGSAAMCEKLGIPKLGDKMSQKRLRWYGHVAESSDWINQCEIEVKGPSRRGTDIFLRFVFQSWLFKVRFSSFF